jgi:ABC-type spermidine/putrescine transport system permease subunit II
VHRFDQTLEEAAMDLGAHPRQIFLRIVLPIIRPGIIATALFSFSLSFDEFIRTVFVVGEERTVPVQFWTMIVDRLAPELPAMAVMIILVSMAAALLGFAYAKRADHAS